MDSISFVKMPDMRSNEICDEQTAEMPGLPVVHESNGRRDNDNIIMEFADNAKYNDAGSLTADEAVQGDTDLDSKLEVFTI